MKSAWSLGCMALLGLLGLGACTPTPPPRWAEGGARLYLAAAHWDRGDVSVDIHPDGNVERDGDVLFKLDSAGRVFEEDGEPIAVLQPDGALVGQDETNYGFVGPQTAAFPGSDVAWLSVGQQGEVVRYDVDGDRTYDGHWLGCTGAMSRTCVLVTHIIVLKEWQQRPRIGVGFGVGFGMMR